MPRSAGGAWYDLTTGTHHVADPAGIARIAFAAIDRQRQHWAELNAALDPMTLAHNALDVIGLIDPTPLSDGLNAALYIAEGDVKNAAISLAGAVMPYAGDLLKVSKLGERIVARATKLADGVSAAATVERKLVSRLFSAGIHGSAGAVTGATLGAMSGFVTGAIDGGSWGSAWEGAWNGAKFGALQGGIGGSVRGFVNPYICFVAGTQVDVGDVVDGLSETVEWGSLTSEGAIKGEFLNAIRLSPNSAPTNDLH